MKRVAALAGVAALVGCAESHGAAPPPKVEAPPPAPPSAPAVAEEAVPRLQLPNDVHAVAERIALRIDPRKERFEGTVDLDVQLTSPRRLVWLNGKSLHVTSASITQNGATVPATWAERDPAGVASLTPASPLVAGPATLHVEYDAPFAAHLKGLHRIAQGGEWYAATQFEAIAAREAFPSFDEPRAKIPFEVTLDVPAGMQAIANGPELARGASPADPALVRVRFAKTPPLPSYLVAFAVGPYDVVDAPPVPANAARAKPLPLRGVAAKGRGKELAYALARTGKIVTLLEGYFGSAFPYDKLDVIAVPDKGGAMENPGAVTFSEYLLLVDEAHAPMRQKKAMAEVMAHELAHQWFGDLVTMAWWDDTWLNEAFASWMGPKIAEQLDPSLRSGISLLRTVEEAMTIDELASARSIRQPIQSIHDIDSAFDAITYRKGAGVLAMFERWVGEEAFKAGVRGYLAEHRFGNATTDDFLKALSAAAHKDVATPMRTFLDQPGVPLVASELRCEGAPRLHVKITRDLPLGSRADAAASWQVPLCIRAEGKPSPSETCTLTTAREGAVPLDAEGCPAWTFANADAAGYVQVAPSAKDRAALVSGGLAGLSTREKLAFASSLGVAFRRGDGTTEEILHGYGALAKEADEEVIAEGRGLLRTARDWLFEDPARAAVEAYARATYRPAFDRLGWSPAKNESITRSTLRHDLLEVLALVGNDPQVRAEAKRRARAYVGAAGTDVHLNAIDANLTGPALAVLGQDADAALFDLLVTKLAAATNDVVRTNLLVALGAVRDPALAARVRALALDPRVRDTERTMLLDGQVRMPETRDATWAWVHASFDALNAKLPRRSMAHLISEVAIFCDAAHADDAEAFFGPRIDAVEGGPRALAEGVEQGRLCAARRAMREPELRRVLGDAQKREAPANRRN